MATRGTEKQGMLRRRRPNASETRALILMGQYRLSAAGLARRLGVSEVTAKRIVQRLRRAGEAIASVRRAGRVYYEVQGAGVAPDQDPLFQVLVPAGATRLPRGKPEDADYDSD